MPPDTALAPHDAVTPLVLRITVPTLLLDGRRPAEVFVHQQQHVIIHADIVQVRGRYSLPGRRIEIFTRRIEAEDGAIDVSGAPVTISHDASQVDPSLDGTRESPDGKPGAPGEHGHHAGSISLIAGEIAGTLRLTADGSRGGNSQRGGHGATPPDGANGREGKFKFHARYGAKHPEGDFGAATVRPPGWRWWWEEAYGEKGGDARPGGNAGPAGQAGNGGNGGQIELCCVAAPPTPPQLTAEAGAAGETGVPATAAPASTPGIGGRNLLWQYHFPGIEWEKYADDPDSDVRDIVAKFGIPARAASGSTSQPGRVPDPPPPAAAGQPGTVTSRQVVTDDIAGQCDAHYLGVIQQCAATDAAHGHRSRALARFQWVANLTRTAQDDESVRLHHEARERIAALEQQQDAVLEDRSVGSMDGPAPTA